MATAPVPTKAKPRHRGGATRKAKNIIGGPSTYEVGSHGRRTAGWRAPTVTPNQILFDLDAMRRRSREAVRNNGFASGAITKLVTNIVGTGIKPLSQAPDPAFREKAQALFAAWANHSDADGTQGWYGQQAQAVRCWLEAGEVFVRLRPRLPKDNLAVSLQLQVLEPEMCPLNWAGIAPNGNYYKGGIELDAIGRRVAYYFYDQRPGEINDWNPGVVKRIPAEQILHVFKPLRAGQLRGVPHLTQAMIRLRELDKFDDATLLRQQLSAMFVAFLEHPTTDVLGEVPILGQEGIAGNQGTGDRPTLGLQPGIFQELNAGEKVTFSDPPDMQTGYVEYMKSQLRSACAAAGVPYEVLTGDMSGLNDRVMRVILHEFRRYVMAEQHETVAFQLCRPVWAAWMDRAYLDGALPFGPDYLTNPDAWQAAKWMPQGWAYIHPVQDVQAANAAIRSGLTSRTDVVAEQGEDAELIDAQQKVDAQRADALGIKYDSDGRFAPGGKVAGAAPAPAPAGPGGE